MCGVTSDLTVDHFRPASRGGQSHPDNLWLLCFRHNKAKGDAWYKADGSRVGNLRGLPDWKVGEYLDFDARMWDRARRLETARLAKLAQSPIPSSLPLSTDLA